MIRLEMKNYNIILIEKQPKCQLYYQAKFINMNILLVKPIEDQGETQIKAIQDQWQVKSIEKYADDAEDTPLISKQKKNIQ